MAERSGVVYMRTTRGAYPVLYGPDETFPVGGAKVVRSSPDDQVTLAGAGVTLHNCLAAAGQLGQDGIRARVLDLYSVKPIDTQTLVTAANATRSRVVVVEDHYYPAGGIGRGARSAQRRRPPSPHPPPAGTGPARLRYPGGAHGGGGNSRRPGRASCPRAPGRLTPPRSSRLIDLHEETNHTFRVGAVPGTLFPRWIQAEPYLRPGKEHRGPWNPGQV